MYLRGNLMIRISITFYDEVHEKLKDGANKKNVSLAQHIRELVEIGSRVEESAAKKQDGDAGELNKIDNLNELKSLWKNSLSWGLETRYLIRYLVENMSEKNKDVIADILKKSTDKADSFVSALLHEKA
jgi:hypothetical protein